MSSVKAKANGWWSWGTGLAAAFVLLAGFYASQHPDSFFGVLVKALLIPIP